MTTLRRILGMTFVLLSAATFSGCKHHYKGYYRNYWRIPTHGHSSDNIQNTASTSTGRSQPTTDPFYAQQAAKREANMRAVQQQNYNNQMENYKRGYSNKLPNY